MIDKRIIDKFNFIDGMLEIKLSSSQKINVMPNNITLYDFDKGKRKFGWIFSLSNMKTSFEIITGSSDLIFLFPNNKKIKIIELNNDEFLLNDIHNLLLWTDGITIETHPNFKMFSHNTLITKIKGSGIVILKYSGILHEIFITKKIAKRMYISLNSLFLFDQKISLKKVTVGEGLSSLFKDELLKIDGEGKIYITAYQDNSLYIEKKPSKLDVLEEVPIIGSPIAVFNKLTK